MKHYIVYETPRVALAAMQREYIEFLMVWINILKTMAGVQLNPPLMKEFEYAWFDKLVTNSSIKLFAILVKEGDDWRYVGHTSLHNITYPDGHAVSGTIIGDTSVHGKGYGTEAKLLLLHHAFYVLGLRKVCSEVKAFNGNSFGHLLRTGYKVVGIRKEHHFYNGYFVDDVLLEIFKADFDAVWNTYQETGTLPQLSKQQREQIKNCTL